MYAVLMGFIPLIPDLIKAGVVSYEAFAKAKKLYDEDRTLTPAERAELEALIASAEARIDDKSKDVSV